MHLSLKHRGISYRRLKCDSTYLHRGVFAYNLFLKGGTSQLHSLISIQNIQTTEKKIKEVLLKLR